MRSIALLTALVLSATTLSPLAAQGPSSEGGARPCTSYDTCALRTRYTFLSTRVVQGADDRPVDLRALLGERSDSAGTYYRSFRSRSRAGGIIGIVGAGAFVAALLINNDNRDLSRGLLAGGIGASLVGAGFDQAARERLSRAVWWYNRELEVQDRMRRERSGLDASPRDGLAW